MFSHHLFGRIFYVLVSFIILETFPVERALCMYTVKRVLLGKKSLFVHIYVVKVAYKKLHLTLFPDMTHSMLWVSGKCCIRRKYIDKKVEKYFELL